MDNNYSIDTGDIFLRLTNEWKKFDRNFLSNQVRQAMESMLINKNIVSIEDDGTNAAYLENYAKVRYPRDIKMSKDANNFPFPDYFLILQRKSLYEGIVNYSEPCKLTPEDNYYDLFFALKLSLTDIMEETEDFLKFHLEETFNNDISVYKNFLEKICLKYSEFLHLKYEPLINLFFEPYSDILKKTEENHTETSTKPNPEFTIARQVMAILYLLESLEISRTEIDQTDIAKFVQFITGRETGAKKIGDTNIYKRVTNRLSKSDKSSENDLQFIRGYFEKLGLRQIVEKINSEILSKE